MSVLLIEDNHNDVILIQRALARCPGKPDVYHARDGEEALDFLQRRGEHKEAPRPDIIISCLNLPKINGLEVLEKLKHDSKLQRIPFVVLTYSEREEDMVRAYTSGAAGFFTKPIDESQFEETVRKLHAYWDEARKPPE